MIKEYIEGDIYIVTALGYQWASIENYNHNNEYMTILIVPFYRKHEAIDYFKQNKRVKSFLEITLF